MAQDSSLPEFWETRYRDGVTPWDAGRVPPQLVAFAATLPPDSRILIPGCGSGHDARFLAESGFDVLAIDFSETAVELARRTLGPFADRVRFADFFDFDGGPPYDIIYERAFLCALPRKMWPAYAPRMATLLEPGGRLAGFWFFGETLKGPPFGTSEAELHGLMAPHFQRLTDESVSASLPVFGTHERWQTWQRR